MKRRMIDREEVVFLDTCLVTLKDMAITINYLTIKYGEDALFHLSVDDYGHKESTVRFRSEETDKEISERLTRNKKIRENKKKLKEELEASERETYLRLQKKYEGK